MPPTKEQLHLDLVIESIREVKGDVNSLFDIVCRGDNNNQPLLARVLILEENNEDFKKEIDKLKSFQMHLKVEDLRAKQKLLILLVTAILGWMTALLPQISWQNIVQWFMTIIK